MKHCFNMIVLTTLITCTLLAGCAAPVPKENIDSLVATLGDEKYRVREAADRKLRETLYCERNNFYDVFALLKIHYELSADPEIKTRLERMLGPAIFKYAQSVADIFYQMGLDYYQQLRYEGGSASPDRPQARRPARPPQ